MNLTEVMKSLTPGERGLLAAEIVQKTDRRHGPVDGRCEICGSADESFVLQDWISWHCTPCVERVVRADFAAVMAVAA